MNFCRLYNKVMNKLKDKHTVVSEVNVVFGTLNIIEVLFVITLEYIFLSTSSVHNKYMANIKMPTVSGRTVMYILGATIFGLVLILELLIGYGISYLLAWLMLFPFMYLTSVVLISAIVCIFNEVKGNYIFNYFGVNPLNYISSKTTSHCNLQNKEK